MPANARNLTRCMFLNCSWPWRFLRFRRRTLSLSSGSILSGHADFWNAWQQDKLEREVTSCLHLDLPCNITGT